jgi:hypothetical protein
MPENDPKTPENRPIPDASGVGGGISTPDSGRGRHRWLDFLTPDHARFLIVPIFPRSGDEKGDRVLKAVGLLSIAAVFLGLAFTVGRSYGEGRAMIILKAKAYELQSRNEAPDSPARLAAEYLLGSARDIQAR